MSKLTAVKYYLDYETTYKNTCDIFKYKIIYWQQRPCKKNSTNKKYFRGNPKNNIFKSLKYFLNLLIFIT